MVVLAVCCCATLRAADRPDIPTPAIVSATPAPDLNALFNNKTGWVGADAAYSVQLAPDRILWLFGDTLIGTVKEGHRTDCVMVNNTVAIQKGIGKDSAIRFVTGKPRGGKATSLFMPADGKGWLWPQAAGQIGDRLYLFLPQIDRTGAGGAFGFKQVAQWLGIVENPQDDPADWRSTQQKLPFCDFTPNNETSWGSAMLVDAGNVYIYGYQEKGKGFGRKRLIVARAPTDQFSDFKSWRFRTAAGWSEAPADAVPSIDGLASEFSVSPLPGEKSFVLVYTENGLGDKITGRFADSPDGPWSAPTLLYTSPEMKKDKGVFCYSAKAHPWAAVGDELVITYCQNTWEFAKVFQSDDIYRPKFVRVNFGAGK